MAKRSDIQGIRGLAIAAVLGFHLDESTFPSGFVGVDMFFVLSGYLMAAILSKESDLSMAVFQKFYTRRFKRIVPLYAILIFALCIFVPCFFLRRDVLKFCEDVVWAAAFATNMHDVLDEKDYFAEMFDSNVLTHTWSLGVEIQYYLIVPFIILAHRYLSGKCNFLLHLLLLASLACQLISSPNAAFNLLSSRVWQFLAGGISYELTSGSSLFDLIAAPTIKYEKLQTEEVDVIEKGGDIDEVEAEEQPKNFDKALGSLSTDLLSLALFAVVFGPWGMLSAPAIRFAVVLMTSGLLVLGSDEQSQGFLLTNRPIVYLGDISYVVYLAHWSIIIIWKSVADSATMPFNASTVDVAAAIKWNELESHTRYYDKRPFKECVNDPEGVRMRGGFTSKKEYECIWKPVNATGNFKILVVGNSISHRATKILKPVIQENFPEVSLMRLFAKSSCSPSDSVRGCRPFIDAIPVLVDAMKPDLTFVIYDNSKRLTAPLVNGSEDAATADLTAFLQKVANGSRFVVLDEFYPQPTSSVGMSTSMHKRLLRNQSTEDLKGSLESFQEKYANYFARLDLIHIPNLLRHNTSAALCAEEKGWCWWYNRRNLHSYFSDNLHLSADGLELLRDSYTSIIRKVLYRNPE